MRVEVVFELDESSEKLDIPWEGPDPATGYFDLRENPQAIERLEVARQHPPLRSFLATVNSADSLFSTVRCKAWPQPEDSASEKEPCEFASRVDIVFAAESFNFERRHYDDLVRRLQELLTRDATPDYLRAALRVHLCRFRTLARWGFCLRITLYARGATAEQAELRWGLGLARVQQALLFVSRILRQHMAQVS